MFHAMYKFTARSAQMLENVGIKSYIDGKVLQITTIKKATVLQWLLNHASKKIIFRSFSAEFIKNSFYSNSDKNKKADIPTF